MSRAAAWKDRIKSGTMGIALKGVRRTFRIGRMHCLGVITARTELLTYQCNICGRSNTARAKGLKREVWSCPYCGSTVRFRAMIHALSLGLFGKSLALPRFPQRNDLIGVGMSDWEGYAVSLARNLGYLNAFYHQEPFLDITAPPTEWEGHFDFVVTSDVLEHVAPPINLAFANLFRLLKPGGLLVMSVPFMKGQSTREHFPDLHRFEILREGRVWVLKNEAKDGTTRIYHDLVFHGGPGTTVEMRLFGREDLLHHLVEAGFTGVEVVDAPAPEYGILWNPHDPEDDSYDAPIYGLDAPPIIARKPH